MAMISRDALAGLKLLFKEAAQPTFQSGFIQEYDNTQDCFVVWNEVSRQHCALLFKQFTVEQGSSGQLLLKAPSCTFKALPARFQGLDGVTPAEGAQPSSCGGSSSITPQGSQQLSCVLSQQLSGLVGRCFSHTEEGFEVAQTEQQHAGSSITAIQCDQQQPQPMLIQRRSRHSTDSGLDDGSYWGSPVKHDSSAAIAAAMAAAGEAGDPSAAAASSGLQQGYNASSMPMAISMPHAQELATPPAAAAAPPGQTGGLSSFQEISRMISASEDISPLARPCSIKTSLAPGHAARLLEEQGTWGTPEENSPWGTPRERQQGGSASITPNSRSLEQSAGQHQGQQQGGSALHKLMFGGEQLHSRLGQEAAVSAEQEQPLPMDSSSQQKAGLAGPALDVLGMPEPVAVEPVGSAAAEEAAAELEPAAAVAAAVEAVDAAAAMEVDSLGEMDFTIPVAMDVQPRPASRNSSRVREMFRPVVSISGDSNVAVDVPQPLSTRHAGMLRSPGRSLPTPSDPGHHAGMTSAFSHAASMAAAQVSASAGGAGAFEQRMTATNIGVSSFGSSHAASRRMSRNASSRLNADQDWALLGPDGQTLQPPLIGGLQAPQQRVSMGQVLHTPAVVSRRASRTLSGRLALDQDLAAALMEQLDDAEPDVLSRPLAPAAPGLDTIISRRQSTSNGRDTPDSDGFGFSEFEGLEPLVPPEEAAAAALTEAAALASAAAATETALGEGLSGGGAGGAHHHRAHRRSARSLGVPPVVNMAQRPSMRLSDQDPGHHGLAALPAMTAAAVSAAAAARAHASAAAGASGARAAGSFDVIMTQAVPEQDNDDEAGLEPEPSDSNMAAAAAPGAAAPTSVRSSRLTSRTNSSGVGAAGSPRHSGTGGSSVRSVSGSLHDGSRRSSKRSIPSIFQAAAAAAEAAAAAAVGFALGGRDRTSAHEQQAASQAAAAGSDAADEPVAKKQELPEEPAGLTANSFLKQRLVSDGLGSGCGSVDSFTCPPFMPLASSITATGGSNLGPSSGAPGGSNGSSLVNSSNGSGQAGDVPVPGASAAEPAADTEMPQAEPIIVGNGPGGYNAAAAAAALAAATMAAEGDGMYGSPATTISSYMGAAGSPNAATAALVRRQQLMTSEGSECGSGALLGSHLHLSTSGIDSPTGSAVFRLGGNSPYPLDTCDSVGAGAAGSVAPGELSAALETLAVHAGCSTGGSKAVGIGASRMAREAAAAAAGGAGGSLVGLVGAAALMVGTQAPPAAGLGSKAAVPGLSEITPCDEDDDPGDGGGKISAKYPSDCGSTQAAGAVFFRLAGEVAAGVNKIATQMVGGQQTELQQGRRSSSSGGAAVSKVLGKILMGKAALLKSEGVSSTDRSKAAAARSSDASGADSSISTSAPPSYAESVGADADDERSPFANPAGRRVWSTAFALGMQGAAAAEPAAEGASDAANGSIRQSAALGQAQQATAAAAAGQQQQVPDSQECLGGAQPVTGLKRRTPHASRTPSQSLPVRPSVEGLGVLGFSSFHYGDDDGQPLMNTMGASCSGQEPSMLMQAPSRVGLVALHAFLALSCQWFDSMALVVLGPQLTGALLPSGTPPLQQLQRLFSVFALGHVLWLLGCLLWPAKGGKLGRRGVLAWTLGLSGFCTALVGCMPSYAEGGRVGIGIIAALRFISGAAASNSAPAALAYLLDRAPQCPNLHASCVPAAMAAGACMASGPALFLSWVMSPAVLGASGWRVVLVLSLLSNAVAGALRGWGLQDPEQHMQAAELADRSNVHAWRIVRQHAPQLLQAVLLQAFAVSGLFLLTAWLPAYLMQLSGMAASTALLVHTLNMAALAGSMLLGGLLADEWAPTPVLLATCAVAVAFGYPAWLLFSMGVAEVTWFAQCTLCVLVGLQWGALPELLGDMFPPGMRCSALTVAHTVPMVALGSTAPLMALGFLAQSGSLASPAYVNIIMAVVTGTVACWHAWRSSGLRL